MPAGAYTVTATPYPEANLGGAPGQARSVSFTVQAHELSVADARAEEGTDATIGFTVTLSAVSPAPVTVDYATADGTATAGADYTAARGTLTFAAGKTTQTIAVAVLDDAHEEGEETMTLTLSRPAGAVLADAEATGTIANRDPLPRALLARFGRTAAVHVVEHVEARLQAPRAPGVASPAGTCGQAWRATWRSRSSASSAARPEPTGPVWASTIRGEACRRPAWGRSTRRGLPAAHGWPRRGRWAPGLTASPARGCCGWVSAAATC